MSGRGLLDADMQTLRSWAVDGWRWWIDELTSMVPRRWRERTARRLALYLWDPAGGGLKPMRAGPGARTDSGAPMAVVLPRECTLIRVIDTPMVGARDLANLVELNADRIMPLARDEVLLGIRVLGSSSDGNAANPRQSVEVAALPRARAELLASTLAKMPRAPAFVMVGAPELGQPAPIDLLPAMRRAGLAGVGDRSAPPLWLAAGFLFALNIGMLAWRDAATLDNLSAVVEQQKPAVKVAHAIITRMRRENAIAIAAGNARRTREPLAILARINSALPAGTWLQRFTWTDDTVKIAGFHPPKTDVADTLRKAGLVVVRYGDTSNEATTQLGEPFEITLRMGRR